MSAVHLIRSPEQWGDEIRASLGRTVEAVVEVGLTLQACKAEVGHGGFEQAVRHAGMSPQTARMFMAIAGSAVGEIATSGSDLLPASWRSLYELTQLGDDLPAAIEAGEIRPDMTRKQVQELVRRYEQERRQQEAEEIEAALEPEPEPRAVVVGEWVELGRHRLYCGDTSSDAFRGALPPAALVFADPPYNANAAEWDRDFVWQHDYLTDVAPVVAVTPGISAIPDFLRSTAMPYRWTAAAHINNGMTRGAVGFGNWMAVLLFSNGSVHVGAQDHTTISVGRHDGAEHKGRKPAELLVWLLDLYTKRDDVVVDPFAGSGTTLFAAERTGRTCITGEIDPDFCRAIVRAWERLEADAA